MQYVNYLNHPLRTISAKEADRLMIEQAMAQLGTKEWTAPELQSVPRPARKHPEAQPRAIVRRATRLKTADVMAVIPVYALAELMGTTAHTFDSWGVYVPKHHDAWLTRLLEHWETIRGVRQAIRQGLKRWGVANAVKVHPDKLDCLCEEFGVAAWFTLPADKDKSYVFQ